MSLSSTRLTKQKLCVDFAALKHACPKGIYVAPSPDEALTWTGVVFIIVEEGPYANAILRFQIDFPDDYPARPPIVSFLSDVFHPLVTPLTTYTYTTRDAGVETFSAADQDRLPPGGLNLRHGFPEWYESHKLAIKNKETAPSGDGTNAPPTTGVWRPPLTVEVLQYLRIVFDTEAILDSVPLEAAANTGAWHAWRSYRGKTTLGGRASSPPVPDVQQSSASDVAKERSSIGSSNSGSSPRQQQQQPGGARRPGEWNWQGVWEDRVKRCIQASISDHMLFSGGDHSNVIHFSKVEGEGVGGVMMASKIQAG